MFKPTDRQMPLFAAGSSLGASARSRLADTWAEHFREKVMPLLFESEADFAQLYPDNGRPNRSVARLLGISLLQNLRDQSDQEALDALAFDVRWQHALGLTSEDAYLSRRSLVGFRQRLVQHDPNGELLRLVFDRIMSAGVLDLGLSTADQRVDSTLICSDIRDRGRLSLARETLRVFLSSLSPQQLDTIPADICQHFERNTTTWEPRYSSDESRSKLHEAGGWLSQVASLFAEDVAASTKPYQLLLRMLVEHADALGITLPSDDEIDDDSDVEGPKSTDTGTSASDGSSSDERKPRQNKQNTKKARFWSAHDSDASCGHKGLGYHAHFTETCNNESTELLTDYAVNTAAISDVGQAEQVAQRLHDRGIGPDNLYADGGYPTPDSMLRIASMGTNLVAPVHRGRLHVDTYCREDFSYNEVEGTGLCPQGHKATRLAVLRSEHGKRDTDQLHIFFDNSLCTACEKRQRCPVRQPRNKRSHESRLELSAPMIARDKRWTEQKTAVWQASYRIRAGVEATMAELKKAHGVGDLRVRGAARVLMQVGFKAIACNIKRWQRSLLGGLAAAIASLLALIAILCRFRSQSWVFLGRAPMSYRVEIAA